MCVLLQLLKMTVVHDWYVYDLSCAYPEEDLLLGVTLIQEWGFSDGPFIQDQDNSRSDLTLFFCS